MIRTLRFTGLLLLNASTVRGRLAGGNSRLIVFLKNKKPPPRAGVFLCVDKGTKTDQEPTQ